MKRLPTRRSTVEQECQRKLDSAKSDQVQEKRRADCKKSAEVAKNAVTLYDDFVYLYCCVVGELNVFDSNGNLRDRQQAEEGVKAGLELIEELNHRQNHESREQNQAYIGELVFHYFDVANRGHR